MVVAFKPSFNASARQRPQNIEAEQSVLGAILFDPNAIERVAPILPSPDAFSIVGHQHIYRTALSMRERGEKIDLMTMLAALQARQLLEAIGGQSKLAQLVDCCIVPGNADLHANLILEKWKRRQIQSAGYEALELASDGERAPESVAALLKDKLEELLGGATISEGRLSARQLQAQLDRLTVKAERGDLKDSELDSEIQSLAERVSRPMRDVRELFAKRQAEREVESERATLMSATLPSLMQVQRQKLDIPALLYGDGGQLARQLIETALAMPTAPEWMFTTLIPAAGSRMGAARVVIKASSQYTQPAIFRSIIAGATGHKKTPAQKVILNALEILEAEHYERFLQMQQDYEAELKATKKGDPPPSAIPHRRRYMITDATIEALVRIHSENPRGFLVYRDEASAFINARNKYRNGKGDDAEQELSEFNGGALSKDRTKESLFISHTAISRTGGTQWETLQKLMAAHEDVTGEWARWLFCAADCPPSYIDLEGDERETGLTETLLQLYQRLDRIERQDYLLSREAKSIFQTKQHQLIDWSRSEDHPGLKAAFPKFESYLGRLALWLHLVNAALGERAPDLVISGQTMRLAATLLDYYIGQLRLIYAHNAPQQELSGLLLKIQAYAQNKMCPVAMRQFKSGISALKKTGIAEIRAHCESLAKAGYGQMLNEKYQATIKPDGDNDSSGGSGPPNTSPPNGHPPQGTEKTTLTANVDSVDEVLTRHHRSESLENQDFQRVVDVVDVWNDGFGNSETKLDSPTLDISLKHQHQHFNIEPESLYLSDVENVDVVYQQHQPHQHQADSSVLDVSADEPGESARERELWADSSDVLVGDVAEAASAPSEIQFIAPPLCEAIQSMEEVERSAGTEEWLAVEKAEASFSTRAQAGVDVIPTADAIDVGAASADISVDATGTDNFPQLGALVWRSPIPSEWNAKTKQRTPFQPGCLCRIVQVTDRGAIALCSSDGSQFHISWHAWQSGLFAPYCGQDGS